MKRIPIVATTLVVLAVAAMIALGIWQLHRKQWKEGLLAQYAANEHRPAVAFPSFPDDSVLFRPAHGFCLRPVSSHLEGAGASGWRMIVACQTGVEGPGMIVQLGVTPDPQAKIAWKGGEVSGFISHAPDHRSLLTLIFDHHPARLMLVAKNPPPGLRANPPPDLSAVPNNHLSYAIQWFLFAISAVVIYILALRKRWREADRA